MFEKSKWIWENANAKPDEYAEFLVPLTKKTGKKYILNISVDTNYSVAVNGKLATFGQYSDYPTRKIFDSVDIPPTLKTVKTNSSLLHITLENHTAHTPRGTRV